MMDEDFECEVAELLEIWEAAQHFGIDVPARVLAYGQVFLANELDQRIRMIRRYRRARATGRN